MKNETKKLEQLTKAEKKIFDEISRELVVIDGEWCWRGLHFSRPQYARRHLIETACLLAAKKGAK